MTCAQLSSARPVAAAPLTSGAPSPMSPHDRSPAASPDTSTSLLARPPVRLRLRGVRRPRRRPALLDLAATSSRCAADRSHGPAGSSPARPPIDTELGILKTGKEADVFLVERAVPDDPAQSVVMAAKRYRGEEHRELPPQQHLHRGPAHPPVPRRPRAGQEDHPRPGRRRGPVGDRRVGRAGPVLARRGPGALPGADRRHRDPDGARHRRRRARAPAGPDPAGPLRCSPPTSTSSARRSPRWRPSASRTATCRRTTCWRRASGWW